MNIFGSTKHGFVLICIVLLIPQAFAYRVGKSSNLGMQKSSFSSPGLSSSNSNTRAATQATSSNQNQTNYSNSTQTSSGQNTTASTKPSIGSIVAGTVAGAAGGYLLAKALDSGSSFAESIVPHALNNTNPLTNSSSSSHLPWGIIGILGIALVFGLMIFRKKMLQEQTIHSMPELYQKTSQIDSNSLNTKKIESKKQTIQPIVLANGLDVSHFLRQTRGIFLHIQSLHTAATISMLSDYMTAELYSDIAKQLKKQPLKNNQPTEFHNLDCMLVEYSTETDKYLASVKFFGNYNENEELINFAEIWHFVAPINEDSHIKWRVAGIQQPE